MFYRFLEVVADECPFLFELSCLLGLCIYTLFNPLPYNIEAQWQIMVDYGRKIVSVYSIASIKFICRILKFSRICNIINVIY